MEDDPDIVLVSYGSPARVMSSAVRKARSLGLRVGGIRLKSLWPFQDQLFARRAVYLTVELNLDGQLVKEVQRAAQGSSVHFIGKCGELPTTAELVEAMNDLSEGRFLVPKLWERWAW